MPLRSISARSSPRPIASPACVAGSTPAPAEHRRRREAALAELDPRPVRLDLDLEALLRVRVHGRTAAVGAARQERGDDEGHHLLQVVEAQRAAAHPPEVELVRLADVQAVDGVAPVDDAGAGEEDVLVAGVAQRAQGARDQRGGVRPQHPPVVDVAAVAGVPGGRLGRVAEPVVVVGDVHDGLARCTTTGTSHASRRAAMASRTSSWMACGPSATSVRSRTARARRRAAGASGWRDMAVLRSNGSTGGRGNAPARRRGTAGRRLRRCGR